MMDIKEWVARELYAIWQEAKSTEFDSWDDVTWDRLPEKHVAQYLLTAERIIEKVKKATAY